MSNARDVAPQVPKDMFERVIKTGDICVYPVRRGSKMWMNRITVLKISHDESGKAKMSGQKQDGYAVNVTSLDRVAIIGREGTIPFCEEG